MFLAIAFKPGDKVRIREAEFDAVVNKVIIERGSVLYQAQWWIEKEWRTGDFYENELEAIEQHEKVEVGVIG